VGVRLKFDLKTDLHEVWHTDIVRRRIEMICKAGAVESGVPRRSAAPFQNADG
jgi:hypothetical protein